MTWRIVALLGFADMRDGARRENPPKEKERGKSSLDHQAAKAIRGSKKARRKRTPRASGEVAGGLACPAQDEPGAVRLRLRRSLAGRIAFTVRVDDRPLRCEISGEATVGPIEEAASRTADAWLAEPQAGTPLLQSVRSRMRFQASMREVSSRSAEKSAIARDTRSTSTACRWAANSRSTSSRSRGRDATSL